MHELSIVMGIIEIAEKQATKNGFDKAEAIELEIGTMAGIEFEALDFAWEMAVKDTILENATRTISKVQARARCVSCKHEFNTDSAFAGCPKCNEQFSEVLCGKELRVKTITF